MCVLNYWLCLSRCVRRRRPFRWWRLLLLYWPVVKVANFLHESIPSIGRWLAGWLDWRLADKKKGSERSPWAGEQKVSMLSLTDGRQQRQHNSLGYTKNRLPHTASQQTTTRRTTTKSDESDELRPSTAQVSHKATKQAASQRHSMRRIEMQS